MKFKMKLRYPVLLIVLAVIVLTVLFRLSESDKKILPEERIPMVVQVAPVIKGLLLEWVKGEGVVRSVKRGFLSFETTGKVIFTGKDEKGLELREGSFVYGPADKSKKGQRLAGIENRTQLEKVKTGEIDLSVAKQDVIVAQSDLNRADKEEKLAAINLKRSKKLYDKKIKTLQSYENDQIQYHNTQAALKTARAQLMSSQARFKAALSALDQAKIDLERTSLFAPFDGVISYFNIKKGDIPGSVDYSNEQSVLNTTPIVIIGTDLYEISVNLPSWDGTLVQPDFPAFITWGNYSLLEEEALSENEFSYAKGTVYSVSPALSLNGRSVRIKVRTKERNENLMDGMPVTCWIVVNEKKDALIAPLNSLIFHNNRAEVFVFNPETQEVKKQVVKTGIEENRKIEVFGLKKGTLLVTDGRFRLYSGMKVAPVDAMEPKESGK